MDSVAEKLRTDVLVIGAGPTGLMAANQLRRFGIDFLIIDQKSGPTKESRAIAVTARSLEIYQQMGLADFVIENGQRIEVGNLYFNGKRKAEIKLGEIGKGLSEFSYLLAFEQSKNEELLAQNLSTQGCSISWSCEFVELKEHADRISVLARKESKDIQIEAQYLIACDGASSPIRQQLNFSFRGGTYKHKFFVADTLLDWPLPYNQLIISPGKENFCAFLPLQGDHNYRIIGTLPKSYFRKEDVEFADIQQVVTRTINTEVQFEKVNWFSTYKLHHRGVKKFRNERVFLAGDSAHIHSPAGGQGMNTGLQDAYNLCWKLSMVIKGEADPSLLDTYNEERLPFAQWLLKFTDRGFNMMTSSNFFVSLFRRYIVLNLVPYFVRISFIRPVIFKVISQIWYSYQDFSLARSATQQPIKFSAGDRFPFIKQDNLFKKLTSPGFHLVCLTKNSVSTQTKDFLKLVFPFEVKLIEIPISDPWRKLGVSDDLFILVRPDNYILFVADALHENILQSYFPFFQSKSAE